MSITTLWKGNVSKVCHSEKEIESATAAGFGPYNPGDHEYPRALYKGAESATVSSLAEENARAKDGWTRTPGEDYGKSVTVTVIPAVPPSNVDERIAGLAARITALEELATRDTRPAVRQRGSSSLGE